MDSLALKTKINRNSEFKTQVKAKKKSLIDFAVSLSGNKTGRGNFDDHIIWESSDGKYKVGVGKMGKEYYLDTISYKDGTKGNNPNDMNPFVMKDGVRLEFDGSFDHVFSFFQHVSKIDERALEILGCLMFRNAYLEDHVLVDKQYTYSPPQDAVDYLVNTIGEWDGISVEAYLHYMEMIAWNEDTKYSSLGYDVDSGIGRQNNMLTYAHIISVLLGKGSLSKLCSQFSRPPVGVSAITTKLAGESFPELKIR